MSLTTQRLDELADDPMEMTDAEAAALITAARLQVALDECEVLAPGYSIDLHSLTDGACTAAAVSTHLGLLIRHASGPTRLAAVLALIDDLKARA